MSHLLKDIILQSDSIKRLKIRLLDLPLTKKNKTKTGGGFLSSHLPEAGNSVFSLDYKFFYFSEERRYLFCNINSVCTKETTASSQSNATSDRRLVGIFLKDDCLGICVKKKKKPTIF